MASREKKKKKTGYLFLYEAQTNIYQQQIRSFCRSLALGIFPSVFFFKIAGDHRVKWPADEVYDIFFLVLVLCFCWVNQRTLDVQCFCPKETSKTYVIHLNILFLSIHFKDFFLDFLFYYYCVVPFCFVCMCVSSVSSIKPYKMKK